MDQFYSLFLKLMSEPELKNVHVGAKLKDIHIRRQKQEVNE